MNRYAKRSSSEPHGISLETQINVQESDEDENPPPYPPRPLCTYKNQDTAVYSSRQVRSPHSASSVKAALTSNAEKVSVVDPFVCQSLASLCVNSPPMPKFRKSKHLSASSDKGMLAGHRDALGCNDAVSDDVFLASSESVGGLGSKDTDGKCSRSANSSFGDSTRSFDDAIDDRHITAQLQNGSVPADASSSDLHTKHSAQDQHQGDVCSENSAVNTVEKSTKDRDAVYNIPTDVTTAGQEELPDNLHTPSSAREAFVKAPFASFSEFDDFGLDPDLFKNDPEYESFLAASKEVTFKQLMQSTPVQKTSDDLSEISHDEFDGALSEDGLSDGGEFCEDNFEFRRPAPNILIKAIPIVPSHQHNLTDRKGYLFKYTSQKGTISKLGTAWLKRWVTLDTVALKYFSSNTSALSKRVIPVCTMVNVEQVIKVGENHPFRFILTTVDRVYQFATDTSDDLSWWTNILMGAILGNKEKFQMYGDMHSPDIAGLLRFEGRRNKRYVAIKCGKLCLYNSTNDFKAFSPIHQIELQLASVKDIGKFRLLLQMPQTALTFVFETQDELNTWKKAIQNGISYALGDDKILELVYANVSNRHCADCRAPGPEWAAIDMGITLCQKCAGIHRTLPLAKIRSLRMDCKVWKPSLIQLMKTIGNENANNFWEWTLTDSDKIYPDSDVAARTAFINSKYKDMHFCHWHPLRGNQNGLNEALSDKILQSDILAVMQLVFSGADTSLPGIDDETSTVSQMANTPRNNMLMEFLIQNSKDRNLSASSNSLSPMSPKSTVFEFTKHNREVTHCGHLYRINPSSKSSPVKRWYILQNGVFACPEGDKSVEVKDTIDQREMISIAATVDEQAPHVFELTTTKSISRLCSFATESHEEQQTWIIKLARSICPVQLSAVQDVNNVCRGGLAFVRRNNSQNWARCWLHLAVKILYIFYKETDVWEECDTRKAVSIGRSKKTQKCPESSDAGRPVTLVMVNDSVIHLQGDNSRETDCWFSSLQSTLSDVKNNLSSQPLSADNIPVVVDKCIKFVTEHGLHTEGIYRRSGQHLVISQLLGLFRSGARSVNLRLEDYQIHDVATVLKRFLRTLDDPLLTKPLYDKWIAAIGETDPAIRLDTFRHLLVQLPAVNYLTLKCIIFHLANIAEYESENLMSISNLATIFGAVLVSSETDLQSVTVLTSASDEICVVRYLLDNRHELFQDGGRLLSTQCSVSENSELIEENDDHVMFPIHIGETESKIVKIKVLPCMKASEVLVRIVENEHLGNPKDWVLQEVLYAAELERPIHYSESLIEVSMRWARWPEEYRYNNYIVLKKALLYQRIELVFDPFTPLYSELRFASDKSFKKYFFEFNCNTLSYRKDNRVDAKVASWNVSNMIIYIGIPLKKNPPSRWGFTFILDTESPVSPYFGRSVCCGSSEDLFYRWLAAMMLAQHPEGLSLPSITTC